MVSTGQTVSPGLSARQRVAVIGAGACGLTAAKCLLDEGLEPVVFERAAEVGGLWNYDEGLADGGGPAYRSLHTNTSKQIMAFSDYRFPEAAPDFPSRAEVLKYLNDYVDYFDFRDHIRFKARVETLRPIGTGQWEVSVRSADSTLKETFGMVMVCSGRYRQPAVPQYPGAEQYQGRMLHSLGYKGPDGFEGRDIVVVGVGSSGADIAAELSKVAQRVYLSTRQSGWFLPNHIGARPYDHHLTRLGVLIPYRIRMRVLRRLVLQEYRRMGIGDWINRWGLPLPAFDVWRSRFTPSSELLLRIAAGAVMAKPGIARLEANHVVFADESRSRADAVICCTGYVLRFPFLDESLVKVTGDAVDLYKHVFHPDLPNLAFIGFCIVAGPQLPVAEAQARWAARVFAGAVRLPPAAEMHTAIRERQAQCRRRGAHPMRIQLLDYLDDIGRMIDVQPDVIRHWRLAPELLMGPLRATQYRLNGPGQWPQAATILGARANRKPLNCISSQ